MRISESSREEILRRTDLVQLVGRKVKLDRKGRIFWGLCPFHKEKSPSFKVENERRLYHCFGCGAGGDAFKWLMETEGLSFPEAVVKLAAEAGIALAPSSPEEDLREKRRKSLYDIVELACAYFESQLSAAAGEAARIYLKGRGLEPDVWARFRLGYAPGGRSGLKDHLLKKGVPVPDMVEAGLVRPQQEGWSERDVFHDRVMFPIADGKGRVVAFGGRGLTPDAKPKYINTGETPLFSKGRLLYRFSQAREAVFRGAPLLVVEGYMDVIALAEGGFPGAVAPLGTALTEDQLAMLWKVAPEPILCFDGDQPGRRAAKRASLLALPHLLPGQSLRFVFLPPDEDPDSFIRGQGSGAMRKLIETAEPLAGVLWRGVTAGRDLSTPERRAGVEAELDRLIKAIRDPRIADYYRRDFAERVFGAFKQRRRASGLRPRRSGAAFAKPGAGKPFFGRPLPGPEEAVSDAVKRSLLVANRVSAPKSILGRRLLGQLICDPDKIEGHAEALALIELDDPQLDRIRHELLNLATSGKRVDKAAVENHLVRQGLGVFAERLKSQSVLQLDLKGRPDEKAREALWRRTRDKLVDPDTAVGLGDLKARQGSALQRYLETGTNADWDELQRLNGEIRKALEADSNGTMK